MLKHIFLIISTALVVTGCASLRQPVPGILYSDQGGSELVTSNASGNRVGEACATSILSLVGTGDASLEAARRNGGITVISSVDNRVESYFFFYAKYCTIVRGR